MHFMLVNFKFAIRSEVCDEKTHLTLIMNKYDLNHTLKIIE